MSQMGPEPEAGPDISGPPSHQRCTSPQSPGGHRSRLFLDAVPPPKVSTAIVPDWVKCGAPGGIGTPDLQIRSLPRVFFHVCP